MAETEKKAAVQRSVDTSTVIAQEVERQVLCYLGSNTEGYRNFLEKLLGHLKVAFLALVSAITVLFIFLNVKTVKDVERLATSETSGAIDRIVTKEFLERRIASKIETEVNDAMVPAKQLIDQKVETEVANAINEAASKNWEEVLNAQANQIQALKAEEIMFFPAGTIVPWDRVVRDEAGRASGRLRELPPGWKVCDGTNGTPDLTGLFLRGDAQSGERGGQDRASTGTVNSGIDLNSHKHQLPINNWSNVGGYSVGAPFGLGNRPSGDAHFVAIPAQGKQYSGQYKLSDTVHRVDLNQHTHSVDIVPAYYTVIFIMKTEPPRKGKDQQ